MSGSFCFKCIICSHLYFVEESVLEMVGLKCPECEVRKEEQWVFVGWEKRREQKEKVALPGLSL